MYTVSSTHNSARGAVFRGTSLSATLKPVKRPVALGDLVYASLQTYLRSGAIAPGQPLQEVQLAELLGVSRTPVREAMMRLASEGMLGVEGRSFVVPELSLQDLDHIYEVRFLVEPAALRAIAPPTGRCARRSTRPWPPRWPRTRPTMPTPSAKPPRAFAPPGWRWCPTPGW